MSGRAFLDSNLVLYLYSQDEPVKRDRVLCLIEKHPCMISIQVLNEFSNVCIKKFKLSSGVVSLALDELIKTFEVACIDADSVRDALRLHETLGYSYYDSLILSTALQNGCGVLFSEDMQDGQVVESRLRITNPLA
jgi:predicted nucleic acid-binding protein